MSDQEAHVTSVLSFRFGCAAICAFALTLTATPFATSAAESNATPPISQETPITFDIPAQPLANALEAYSIVTGLEVLYDSGVALQRHSATVHGTFTAADALRVLLTGTSLSARSIAQGAITVIPLPQMAPDQSAVEPTPDKSTHRLYFGLIQAGVERAFCRVGRIRPGGYRAVLKFAIAINGQIWQSSLVGTTGNDDRDRMIERTLDGVSLGSPPPADLQQPIMMVVLPQSSGHVLSCSSIQ